MEIRINKYLASCGIGSRRKVEELLWKGEFEVNGKKAEPGQIIDPEKDKITRKGKTIASPKKLVYYALNKPLDTLSTNDDEFNRKTVRDLIKSKERLFPVGRLDKESTGLIILTNDGDLSLKLTHPKYHKDKTYEVTTQEHVSSAQLEQLEKGVRIMGKTTAPAKTEKTGRNSFKITIHEGMNRQIRKMANEVHLTVKSLHRISIGDIEIGDLKPGEYRELDKYEVETLKS